MDIRALASVVIFSFVGWAIYKVYLQEGWLALIEKSNVVKPREAK